MTRAVFYSPRSRQQLTDLYLGIAEESGYPSRAEGFVTAIIDYCDGLADFPMRGVARDDLRPGLRTTGFRCRIVIAFAVTAEAVEAHGIYCDGQDYETLLRQDAE